MRVDVLSKVVGSNNNSAGIEINKLRKEISDLNQELKIFTLRKTVKKLKAELAREKKNEG